MRDIQLTDADKKRVREDKDTRVGITRASLIGGAVGGCWWRSCRTPRYGRTWSSTRRLRRGFVVVRPALAQQQVFSPVLPVVFALHRAIASHKDKKKHAEDAQHLAMADRMGRILARSEKTAFDMKAVGGMATKALGAAKANPALAGAAVGAVGGALAGGPDNRLGGALGGAALGGAAGHAAHGISGHMAGGASFGDAAKAYGGGLAQKAQSMGGGTHASPSVLGRSSPTPAAQVSLAPPNPMDFAAKDWRGRPKVGSKE